MGREDEQVVVVGLGQLGAVLAAGLRDDGREVVEVHRGDLERLQSLERARAAILSVPEDALAAVVEKLPPPLADRVVLVQNDLVPSTWRELGLASPTVAVVWFEKKGDVPPRVLLPTVIAGPHAPLVLAALARRAIPAEVVSIAGAVAALVAKNVYILVSNLAGLAASREGSIAGVWSPTGVTTMGELLADHASFARALAEEVFAIELARCDPATRAGLSFDAAWRTLELATEADRAHACMGRTAPQRLARAAARAVELGVTAPIVAALARAS